MVYYIEELENADNRGMKKSFFAFAVSLWMLLLSPGCKTPPPPLPPPPQPDPSALLRFEGIDASDIDHVGMEFKLILENPRPDPARAKIEDLKVEINGLETEEGILIVPETAVHPFPVDGESADSRPGLAAVPLRLELDLETLGKAGLSLADDYHVKVSAAVDFSYGPGLPVRTAVLENAVFPRIQKPLFTITDIAVLQAELINTRFRVKLKVENPNPFPMELSAFRYLLYGDGRFWADGNEKNVLSIPARDSAEAKLFLIMNFMGMKRDLLDQVIAFQDVRYRFTGEALVSTGIEYLPTFPSGFDLSGYSEVLE
jgi:LEA14-like dessication related protein